MRLPLIDHEAKGHTIGYLGREKVDRQEGIQAEGDRQTSSVDYYYLDTETYLRFREGQSRDER
ncbi:MAG: hypothetical protein R3B51_14695 [Thermodesulfobacteriota bacterium]